VDAAERASAGVEFLSWFADRKRLGEDAEPFLQVRSDGCLGLAAKREQAVDAGVAKPEAGPEDDGDEDRDEGTADRLAVAEVDAGGSAKIAGEENGSGERGAGDEVEDCAGDLDVGEVVNVMEREAGWG
jgi:hypothetical protein